MLRRTLGPALTIVVALCTLVAGCSAAGSAAPRGASAGSGGSARTARTARTTATRLPGTVRAAGSRRRPAHVVIVVLENHSYAEVLGGTRAPYLRQLAAAGTTFTRFSAIGHPSQPNYFALFAGSTHGVGSTPCPRGFRGPDLGSSLRSHGYSFAGYAEGLPRVGSTVCHADGRNGYVLRHAPWTSFTDLPPSASRSMRDFPADPAALPTVSFVIPDLADDMHNGTVARSDGWLRRHLAGYVGWARSHNSLLVITTDEDDRTEHNRIPTLIVGDHVPTATDAQHLTLYSLLRFIEDSYGLPRLGHSATAVPIRGLAS